MFTIPAAQGLITSTNADKGFNPLTAGAAYIRVFIFY